MTKPKMSNAERQNAFRARKKNDPERNEEYKKYIFNICLSCVFYRP